MKTPRTVAVVLTPEQAGVMRDDLTKSLDAGAGTVLIYNTLEKVEREPVGVSNLPPPNLVICGDYYTIGLEMDPDDFLAGFHEMADHVEREESGSG